MPDEQLVLVQCAHDDLYEGGVVFEEIELVEELSPAVELLVIEYLVRLLQIVQNYLKGDTVHRVSTVHAREGWRKDHHAGRRDLIGVHRERLAYVKLLTV